ncbi:MAG: hypothetical protein ACFFCW_12890, partial [Candidatus Hodarchaeota archaeon]
MLAVNLIRVVGLVPTTPHYSTNNSGEHPGAVPCQNIIALKKLWYKWTDTLIFVKPETVIHWQRRRFKKHWTKISSKNKKYGRRITKKELRDLIYKMARENKWGAPRIYSELLMLGFTKKEISQSTVSRYLRRFRSKNPDHKKRQSWMTFLKNHREAISAIDFFVVPTVNFTIVYV